MFNQITQKKNIPVGILYNTKLYISMKKMFMSPSQI